MQTAGSDARSSQNASKSRGSQIETQGHVESRGSGQSGIERRRPARAGWKIERRFVEQSDAAVVDVAAIEFASKGRNPLARVGAPHLALWIQWAVDPEPDAAVTGYGPVLRHEISKQIDRGSA